MWNLYRHMSRNSREISWQTEIERRTNDDKLFNSLILLSRKTGEKSIYSENSDRYFRYKRTWHRYSLCSSTNFYVTNLDYRLNKNFQSTFLIRELYAKEKWYLWYKKCTCDNSDTKINYTIKISNNENSLKFNIFW